MSVLVGYASRHGSTREVAQRLAAALEGHGQRAEVLPLGEVDGIAAYDAVVFGSAVYASAWLRDASEFAGRHARELARIPVWTFSVGFLERQGGLLARATWPDAREVGAVRRAIGPRGHRFFAGALEERGLSPLMRLIFRGLGGRYGDFRDWDEVTAWAGEIARDLASASPAGGRAGR